MMEGEQHRKIDPTMAQLGMRSVDQARRDAHSADICTHHDTADQADPFRVVVQQDAAFVQCEVGDHLITFQGQGQSDRPRGGVAVALHVRESAPHQLHRLATLLGYNLIPARYLYVHYLRFMQ